MESFRVRIARVTLKESGLVVHRLPEPDEGEPEPPMVSSFLDATYGMLDNSPNLAGYVVIGFTKDAAAIALDHAPDFPHHQFMIMAQHVLEHYERYDNTAGDQEIT